MTTAWAYISELDAFELYQKIQEEAAESDSPEDFSFSYAFRNALSGAAGTAVSNVITYPLDLICTRLQVQTRNPKQAQDMTPEERENPRTRYDGPLDAVSKIYSEEGGLSGFYAGLGSDTVKSVLDSFCFFFAYNVLWRTKKKYAPVATNPFLQAIDGISVGVLAGAITKAITSPIQVIATKQQTQHASEEQNALEIALQTIEQENLSGFWKGYSESLVLTLNPALTFFVDANLRRAFGGEESPSALKTFILAASGKATANVLMYPFKLAKARAQVAPADEAESEKIVRKVRPQYKVPGAQPKRVPKGPLAAISYIAQTEGIGALYAGVGLEVVKGFFAHGITMLIKEQVPEFMEDHVQPILLPYLLRMYVAYARWKKGKKPKRV